MTSLCTNCCCLVCRSRTCEPPCCCCCFSYIFQPATKMTITRACLTFLIASQVLFSYKWMKFLLSCQPNIYLNNSCSPPTSQHALIPVSRLLIPGRHAGAWCCPTVKSPRAHEPSQFGPFVETSLFKSAVLETA